MQSHVSPKTSPLSYSNKDELNANEVNADLKLLYESFSCVALRITPSQFNKINGFTSIILKNGDYLILDIDSKVHTNPAFKKIYREIIETKKNKGFKSVLLNSNRPQNLYNKNIVDGEPIEEIDNSLLEMYSLSTYKFDGFGDYACISNTLPTTGGAISPAGIFYSLEGNFFVGYKGRTQSLSEFNEHIAPSIMSSPFWAEYTEAHHNECPGCRKIMKIVDGDSGRSQGMWKGITMSHYIYTVDQWLNNK